MAAKEQIKFPSRPKGTVTPGSVGLKTQIPGGATTVSAVAAATGGIGPGSLVETDK